MSEIEKLITERARQDVGAITGHLRSCVCPLCNAKVLRLTTSMRRVADAAVQGVRQCGECQAMGNLFPDSPVPKWESTIHNRTHIYYHWDDECKCYVVALPRIVTQAQTLERAIEALQEQSAFHSALFQTGQLEDGVAAIRKGTPE